MASGRPGRSSPFSGRNRSKTVFLFDHLIGAAKQRQRESEAERLGGLQVDDELNFVDSWIGRSAGFSPLRIRPI
jgi:hypothetical protein